MIKTRLLFPLLIVIYSFIAIFCTTASLPAQDYFPEVGAAALHQRIQDVKGNLHVLSIAIHPGFEDLASLAYFRMGKGAKVTSVYATNGEAGESDRERVYPQQLAATRREEAGAAMKLLNGEAYFLNLPDMAAVPSAAEAREQWPRDSVQYRLMKVISQVRPDIILIARDQETEGRSLRWTALMEDVVRSVERLRQSAPGEQPKELSPFPRWTVSRVIADDGTGKGLALPTHTSHPVWKKTYDAIGKEAAEQYVSLNLQRRQWSAEKGVRYQVLVPASTKKLRAPDEGLPEAIPSELGEISRLVEKVMKAAAQLRPEQTSAKKRPVLTQLADAVEAVDMRLARAYSIPSRERKILLDWKEDLENLRLTLLGVTVSFTISHTAVTHMQLIYFSIDSVSGLSDSGKTEIYFPAVGKGIILNEELESKLPLTLKEGYRLLFRDVSSFNSPHWFFGLEENTLGRPLYVFIIHKAKQREENFIYRMIIPMDYVPRLMPEVLTPIVRAIPNERLAFRITNNSRDGIRDIFHANDSVVVSSQSQFRLNEKGSVHEDTLVLNWTEELPEGSHILPLKIGEQVVESYVARSFYVAIDSSKRISFVEGIGHSLTRDALRRLGIGATGVQFQELTDQ
ncbi:MAG: PIG-L family deacetylase, partial [Nitrososphaera sp.]|nr:PIG-L family deacetylase [Nitrososphaera sp.]